jgi:hypothetical protein
LASIVTAFVRCGALEPDNTITGISGAFRRRFFAVAVAGARRPLVGGIPLHLLSSIPDEL